MKKLILITILIGGCATSIPQYATSAYERELMCNIKHEGEYSGNCHLQSAYDDPNYNKVQKYLQKYYPQTHAQNKALAQLNTQLIKQLESGQITPDKANKLFWDKSKVFRLRSQTEFLKVAKQEEKKRQENALAWQQLGQALSESNAMLNQNNPTYNQNNRVTAPKLQVSYQLKSSFIEYNSKVCVYSYRTYTQSWKTSTLVSCPATKYFANPE